MNAISAITSEKIHKVELVPQEADFDLSLIISVLALIASVASIFWQTVAWIRSGPRIKIKWEVIESGSGATYSGFVRAIISNSGRSDTKIWFIHFEDSNGEKVTPLSTVHTNRMYSEDGDLPAGGVFIWDWTSFDALHRFRKSPRDRGAQPNFDDFVIVFRSGHGDYKFKLDQKGKKVTEKWLEQFDSGQIDSNGKYIWATDQYR